MLESIGREKYPFPGAIKSMFCISGGFPKLNSFQLLLKKIKKKKKTPMIPAVFLKAEIPMF